MTSRPYELLARFGNNGTVAGVSVRMIETIGGRDYEGDPSPLSGISDPAFTSFASQFAASAVAERDAAVSALQSMTSERDGLSTANASLTAENSAQAATITDLQSQLQAAIADRDSYHAQATSLQSQLDTANATIASLQSQLSAPVMETRPGPNYLYPYEFVTRFTSQERAAIRAAISQNDQLADYWGIVLTVRWVIVTDALTIQGVQGLELAGLIQADRVAEILKPYEG